ncbi:MAG: HesA/MoeB/ThiF family protein [Deltaproteobacteria bacterium]|nr:HesA/MoeB/ThiF family protein [Deltaproteobacteria bacterium]
MLDGFGEPGQERLKASRVLVAGLGGLGTVAAQYLAAAGIGRIVLVDYDVVVMSNLNRQILHWESDLGRRKTDSAAEKLSRLNSTVTVIPRYLKIDDEITDSLVTGMDVVIDALDNLEARQILNRSCVKHRVPFIFGGINGLKGMVTTILPGRTPCLACLFPSRTESQKLPVLGATPGVIAGLQVTEAIKYLTGNGRLLANRLLTYDGEIMRFKDTAVSRNPECPVCRSLV